ncbi:MAG TPA: hypothetical protein VFT19_03045 [Solirubrobacterales bacterium]|nr:hypothetical protein [Solirubrobacterales bacterium]
MKRDEKTPAEVAEAVRVKRLREDAKRPISVNLAETIALSHDLLKMDLRAMKRAAGRGQDLVDLENLDAAEV